MTSRLEEDEDFGARYEDDDDPGVLGVIAEGDSYYLAYFFEEDGQGATVGQYTAEVAPSTIETSEELKDFLQKERDVALRKLDFDTFETLHVELTALYRGGELDRVGFAFPTMRKANAACRRATAARINARNLFDVEKTAQQRAEREEWPEWARTALAAGWEPPEGWNP